MTLRLRACVFVCVCERESGYSRGDATRVQGYYYAGLQNSSTCYCGDSYGRYGYTPSACTLRCQSPYDDQLCGGVVNNFIYDTGLCEFSHRCRRHSHVLSADF